MLVFVLRRQMRIDLSSGGLVSCSRARGGGRGWNVEMRGRGQGIKKNVARIGSFYISSGLASMQGEEGGCDVR